MFIFHNSNHILLNLTKEIYIDVLNSASLHKVKKKKKKVTPESVRFSVRKLL